VRLFGQDALVVHLDRAIGTVLGTLLAADAPVLDDNVEVIAATDRANRTADHAHRIATGPARGRNEEAIEAFAVEEEPRSTVGMRFDTLLHALIAARAAIQVDQHQLLALDEAHGLKAIRLKTGSLPSQRLLASFC